MRFTGSRPTRAQGQRTPAPPPVCRYMSVAPSQPGRLPGDLGSMYKTAKRTAPTPPQTLPPASLVQVLCTPAPALPVRPLAQACTVGRAIHPLARSCPDPARAPARVGILFLFPHAHASPSRSRGHATRGARRGRPWDPGATRAGAEHTYTCGQARAAGGADRSRGTGARAGAAGRQEMPVTCSRQQQTLRACIVRRGGA